MRQNKYLSFKKYNRGKIYKSIDQMYIEKIRNYFISGTKTFTYTRYAKDKTRSIQKCFQT